MIQCPLPIQNYPKVLLAHGGGGTLMRQLIDKMIVPAFQTGTLKKLHDGAVLTFGKESLAFTTDSFVVSPLFFPGGDIGTLAVNGTVNDLAMCGARPLYLSCGFILEEGLDMDTLWKVIQSMKQAAEEAGVRLVTGDTKVVNRGKGDGLYINTAGIGLVLDPKSPILPSRIRPGDGVLVNGDLGRHGMAIMAVREGLAFESQIKSDCAPLWKPVEALLAAGVEVHCLRDLTRGGLSSALNEIAGDAHMEIQLVESDIPLREDVRGACEILGIDPFYVANEGRFCAFVASKDTERALKVLAKHPGDTRPALIGRVAESVSGQGRVTLRTSLGPTRILDMLSGEPLPRIC